jgi:hypothetical protein
MTNHTTLPTPGEIEAMREEIRKRQVNDCIDAGLLCYCGDCSKCDSEFNTRETRLLAAYTEKSEECERLRKELEKEDEWKVKLVREVRERGWSDPTAPKGDVK